MVADLVKDFPAIFHESLLLGILKRHRRSLKDAYKVRRERRRIKEAAAEEQRRINQEAAEAAEELMFAESKKFLPVDGNGRWSRSRRRTSNARKSGSKARTRKMEQVKVAQDEYQLFVSLHLEKNVIIFVKSSTTLHEVKGLILKQCGVEAQRFMHAGKQLALHLTCIECGLERHSELLVLSRSPGGMQQA